MPLEFEKTEDEMYSICKVNDSNFDGEFFLGVLSTKIYCLPSCKAKMPLRKNIRFFKGKDEAVSHGLRGCLRCRSEFYPFTQPDWLETIKKYLLASVDVKVEDIDLERIAGVNISTIRRYFKQYLGTTMSEFHRRSRLQKAKALIENGESILDVPYMTGFSSVSGFRSAFQKEFNATPGEIKNGKSNA